MKSQIFKLIAYPAKKLLFLLAGRIKIGPIRKTIHIVRLDAIGDFVLFSAILPYFKKLYPDYKIVLIVDTAVKDLALWLNEHHYFDELIAIDGKQYNRNFFYYYGMLKRIRLSAPEIVIQPTFSRTQKSDEVVLVLREALKIAYRGDLSNIDSRHKVKSDAQYNRLISNPESFSEPDRNKHFINELAGREVLVSGTPCWEIAEESKAKFKNRLESVGVDLVKPLVAICPGSSRSVKNWPAEHFVSLMEKLREIRPELQFMLIGGPKERELCTEINKAAGGKNVYDFAGQLALPELAQMLSLVNLYIGNDTGALHMSCAVGVSVVAIMSGEHGKRFFPYAAAGRGAENVAIFSKSQGGGVKNILVDDVFSQAIRLLSKVEK